MTLSDFLLARIAEDETVAREAWGNTWTARPRDAHGMRVVSIDYSTDQVTASIRAVDATHIARHDPARVLAECEAKRQIVELHTPIQLVLRNEDEAPSLTLSLLALPYADHPDYREEWKS